MADDDSFDFNTEDFERLMRGAGQQLRGALDQFGRFVATSGVTAGRSPFGSTTGRRPRPTPDAEPTGASDSGVWVIYSAGTDGRAMIEQVFADELGALRANQHSTGTAAVRFLPYGMPVTVLDAAQKSEDPAE